MFLGAALILGALLLFIHNQMENRYAIDESVNLLPQLLARIDQNQQEIMDESTVEGDASTVPPNDCDIPVEYLEPSDLEMPEVEIDGYGYIGYLSIPALELELPIMGNWDYTRLRIAPCRYTGSILGEDLVLMAHNYASHFGHLSELSEGDSVIFTDMNGIVTRYQVVGKDILDPYAVEEMTSGDFDLTLFTCTYGGQTRVTVYCDKT